jgi:hypothetical protein
MIRILLLILGVVIVFVLYDAYETKKCHDMAQNAAVEEINPSTNPHARAREELQEEYIRRYMQSCKG